MRHPVRGLLIGPLVAPIAYWIGVLLFARPGDARFDWSQVLRELMAIVPYGLPVAYAATLLLGTPMLYALHRLHWLRAWSLVLAGAIGGVAVAMLFAWDQHGALFQVIMPLSAGAALGALVAAVTWWTGR